MAHAVLTPRKVRDDLWTLPSGLPVAFVGARLHVTDVATGTSTALGPEESTTFSPAWSPDGARLAYYSDEGGTLRAWIFDVATRKETVAADLRIKVQVYSTTAMPPTWSPDGRQLLVPALPADEAHADPRPPRGRPATGKGRAHPGTGVLVLQSGAEPAPPAHDRVELSSQMDSAVDLTAIDVEQGTMRVLLPAKMPGRSGPAFARYSPSGRFLAYVSRIRPAPRPEADVSMDVGVVKVGEHEPLFAEEVSRIYEGRESYAGDLLGRGGVLLAWHPTDDVLLFLKDHRLRRVDCAVGSKPQATDLAPEGWGRLNGDYLAFTPNGRAVLVGLLPKDADANSPKMAALGLIPLDGSPPRRFALDPGIDAGQVIRRDGVSLWQPEPNTATLVTAGLESSGTLIHRLDLNGGQWTKIRQDPATVEFQGMPRDGSFVLGIVQSYSRPPDIYRLGADFSPASAWE